MLKILKPGDDHRVYDIADMLEDFGVEGGEEDWVRIATEGAAIFDVGGEEAAEKYFLPLVAGSYGDMRDMVRLLTTIGPDGRQLRR